MPNISFEFVPIPKPHPSAATCAHLCPPMLFKLRPCIKKYDITNNIAPMPTQNPWAWVWQCRAHVRSQHCTLTHSDRTYEVGHQTSCDNPNLLQPM